VTILNGVPATYQRPLEHKTVTGLPKLERGSLRLISVAGAALDLVLKSDRKRTRLAQRLRHHRMCARHFKRPVRWFA
jgi:hypothetical protein